MTAASAEEKKEEKKGTFLILPGRRKRGRS